MIFPVLYRRCFMLILIFQFQFFSVNARCLNWCNQRGICTSPQEGGYCICNMGFTGEDCSQRYCPWDFDPMGLSDNSNRKSIRLETGLSGGEMTGKYSFEFGGSEVYLNADARVLTSDLCTTSLSGLKSITDANCTRESFNDDTGIGTYLISLLHYPQEPPFMNNIIVHNGQPSINMFHCNVSKIDHEDAMVPYCMISDAAPYENLPIYSECSNHGECDRVFGKCACEKGFKGVACNDMKDTEDIQVLFHDGPFFTGTLMKLNMDRLPNAAFNLLQTQIRGSNVTTLTGNHELIHSGNTKLQGNLLIESGSIELKKKRLNHLIDKDDVSIDDSDHEDNTDDNIVYSVTSTGDAFFAGSVNMGQGTLTVLANSGVVEGKHMKLSNNLDVSGSVNIEESLTIGSGFALTPGGMTVDVASHSGTLFELRSRQVGFNGSLLELHAVGEESSLIKSIVDGVTTFEMSASGDIQMNSMKLTSGGIHIIAGGLQIDGGGLFVNGDVTLQSGELHIIDQQIHVKAIKATSAVDNLIEPLFRGHAANRRYSGNVLDLSMQRQQQSNTQFYTNKANFMQFRKVVNNNDEEDNDVNESKDSEIIFQIDESGNLQSTGGAIFNGVSGLKVLGGTKLQGGLALKREVITPLVASEDISGEFIAIVPHELTYAVIANLNPTSKKLVLQLLLADNNSDDSVNNIGRLIIISNQCDIVTSGDAVIPSKSTVMLLYDGSSWINIEALKAPMQKLSGVQVLQAANDLDIGNHTLTAVRFQATGIKKKSIIFAGEDGLMVQSDKFTYHKGVFSTPAARIEKLLTNLDVRGNEISNALLLQPKLFGAKITADEFVLSNHKRGFAYFNEKGLLLTVPALQLDENNNLMLKKLYTDLDARQHILKNVNIEKAQLTEINSVSTHSLELLDLPRGELLLTDSSSGIVSVADKYIKLIPDSNEVQIYTLSVENIHSPVNFHHHDVSNIHILSGTIDGISKMSVDDLTVTGLSSSTASRLLMSTTDGRIQHVNEVDIITIPNISIRNLAFESLSSTASTTSKHVDFGGRMIKNVLLDLESINFNDIFTKYTEDMKSSSDKTSSDSIPIVLTDISNSHSGFFVTHDSNGNIGAMPDISMSNRLLDIRSEVLQVNALKALGNIQITRLPEVTILGTDELGNLQRSEHIKVNRIDVKEAIHLQSSSYTTTSSLLAIDTNGFIISLPKDKSSSYSPQASSSEIDAYIHDLEANEISCIHLKATKSDVSELYLNPPSNSVRAGSMLTLNKHGLVSPNMNGFLSEEDGLLRIKGLASINDTTKLVIENAMIYSSNITNTIIHDSTSISTESLVVRKLAEFQSDVVIDGDITVHGTVVGSGPYVDSSDLRFKENITNMHNALDMIQNLQAVTYNYRTQEYRQRNFPNTLQVGWIADEVHKFIPEIVIKDQEGYLGVAYSHATVLVAEAVKELKIQHDIEINLLKNEIQELKVMMQLIMNNNKQQ